MMIRNKQQKCGIAAAQCGLRPPGGCAAAMANRRFAIDCAADCLKTAQAWGVQNTYISALL
ncbi:MAG: hypothetical protein RRZ73_02035 [Oscillospiraceae bacterium]